MDASQRSQRACSACRIAKVRCSGDPDNTCTRCRAAAIACVFPANRRGRVKGSKNRKTLERQIRTQDSTDGDAAAPIPSDPDDGFDRQGLAQLDRSFPVDMGPDADLPSPVSSDAISPQDRNLQQPLLFLADCARKGWHIGPRAGVTAIPRPTGELPLEDQGRLAWWTPDRVPRIIQDQAGFFRHGLYGFKRDVGPGLDAVQRGIVGECDVQPLFDSYFRWIQPHCPMLDPQLHTPSFVRQRSAYLFAVILALGAVGDATYHGGTHISRTAVRLYAHAEKLHLVVCATAVKSIEIIQAQLLLVMYAQRTQRLVDDQRAIRLGIALRMASMIGLQHTKDSVTKNGRNELLLRVCLVLQESRWESLSDRNTVSNLSFDLTDDEADTLDQTHPSASEAILAADYALHRFEIGSKERITAATASSRAKDELNCELVYIKSYIADWRCMWRDVQPDPLKQWYFSFMSYQSLLVGLLRIIKARSGRGLPLDRLRDDLYETATAMLRDALSLPNALHMLRPTTTLVFAATIIWQLSDADSVDRDMILSLGLRLAGRPSDIEQVMLFARHNGLQLLNMLCLAKRNETRDPVPAMQPIATAPPPGAGLASLMPDGMVQLEQLLSLGDNVLFPQDQSTATQLVPDLGNLWGTADWALPDTTFAADRPAADSMGIDWLNMMGGGIQNGNGQQTWDIGSLFQ